MMPSRDAEENLVTTLHPGIQRYRGEPCYDFTSRYTEIQRRTLLLLYIQVYRDTEENLVTTLHPGIQRYRGHYIHNTVTIVHRAVYVQTFFKPLVNGIFCYRSLTISILVIGRYF